MNVAGVPVRQTVIIFMRIVASLMLLALGVWTALALSFLTEAGDLAAIGTIITLIIALWALWRRANEPQKGWHALWPMLPFVGATALAFIVFFSAKPHHDRAWSNDVAYLATGQIKGDILTLDHVRQFRWRADDRAAPEWRKIDYDLNDLFSVDLVASYWMGEAIAHTMLSFGFQKPDGTIDHLVFSTEIRKENNESYSALAGFFRQYELAIIATDEIDSLGVRTQVRQEDVRIYPLAMPKATARQLLLRQVALANKLARRPEFYNTITANCTTVPFQIARLMVPGLPRDWRVLASGYFPDYLYDLGVIPNGQPFSTIRAAAQSSERAKMAKGQNDFSQAIRVGLPKAGLF